MKAIVKRTGEQIEVHEVHYFRGMDSKQEQYSPDEVIPIRENKEISPLTLFVARDKCKDGGLFLYRNKPLRNEETGYFYTDYETCFQIPANLFPKVTWENSPIEFSLEDLLLAGEQIGYCGLYEFKGHNLVAGCIYNKKEDAEANAVHDDPNTKFLRPIKVIY